MNTSEKPHPLVGGVVDIESDSCFSIAGEKPLGYGGRDFRDPV